MKIEWMKLQTVVCFKAEVLLFILHTHATNYSIQHLRIQSCVLILATVKLTLNDRRSKMQPNMSMVQEIEFKNSLYIWSASQRMVK